MLSYEPRARPPLGSPPKSFRILATLPVPFHWVSACPDMPLRCGLLSATRPFTTMIDCSD